MPQFACEAATTAREFCRHHGMNREKLTRPEQSLTGQIDYEVVRRVLHKGLTSLTLNQGAYFVNDQVMEEFWTRLLQLAQLSRFVSHDADKIGDFSKIIHWRSNFSKLQHLTLCRFIPNSRASSLLAKGSAWCNVEHLKLDRPRKETPTTAGCFVWNVLSNCTNPRTLLFYNFKGGNIEAFALERRARTIEKKSAQPRSLQITTSKNRVSLKHLLARTLKLSTSEVILLTPTCSSKIRYTFQCSELQYWKHIGTKKVGKYQR